MSDGVNITPGVGVTVSTDDIAGVQVQRVKVQTGADGTATDVSTSNPMPVDGSAVTQPVSAASLPLPSGASTAAKQPALGTAGTASADVISVQGIASMTALKVDASGVAVPVTDNSGSLTVDNNGTFAVQATLAAGAAVIGHVIVDSGTVSTITNVVHVDDNSASLTVDAPVGTPAFVRLSDGSAAITTLPVSLASVPSHAVTVASGGVASGAIASGAVASGAFASGSIASGAIVAGAVAAGASSFVKLEDVASADADAGVPAMAVRKASPANTSGTDGDYEMLQMSAGRVWTSSDITIGGTAVDGNSGNKSAQTVRVVLATDQPALTNKLLVTPDSVALPANQSTNISQINAHTALEGGTNGSLAIGGTVATNVAITANPINLGAQAVSSENSAATTARQVQLVADLVGKLIVLPYANPENFVSGAITSAMTGTTTTSLIAAPAAGLRNYITQITVSNSHATVGTDIIIQDGSGGTTLYVIPAAAVYGGATLTFPVPLRQPTTATAIFCANVTTGSNTKVSASGYKGA